MPEIAQTKAAPGQLQERRRIDPTMSIGDGAGCRHERGRDCHRSSIACLVATGRNAASGNAFSGCAPDCRYGHGDRCPATSIDVAVGHHAGRDADPLYLVRPLLASHLRTPPALLAGAPYGLALYVINLYGFTMLFPWFAVSRRMGNRVCPSRVWPDTGGSMPDVYSKKMVGLECQM